MSTTGATADPLAALGLLPGVAESVESVRKAVDRVYGHRIMRCRSNEITSEAALRGARGSAALSGADWALEEVRRRTDFSGDDEAHTVGAALRRPPRRANSCPSGASRPSGCWPGCTSSRPRARRTPSAGPARTANRSTSRSSTCPCRTRPRWPVGSKGSQLIIAGGSAPALVTAAVVHGELLALRPFGTHNGLIARAAERIVLVGSGLDPKVRLPGGGRSREAGPRGLPGHWEAMSPAPRRA